GEVRNPSEAALAATVKRQTGTDALQFLTVAQARKVIEILKSWCARVGYDIPTSAKAAKIELLRAQWHRLAVAGATEVDGAVSLDDWVAVAGALPNTATVSVLTTAQLDQAAEVLGKRVRRAVGKASPLPTKD
ncbi:MAG: regulatory protein GemA, partial [Magnetospirillum sp.]|nr:regulatory protein GemA [Magnetospirillum sp.]